MEVDLRHGTARRHRHAICRGAIRRVGRAPLGLAARLHEEGLDEASGLRANLGARAHEEAKQRPEGISHGLAEARIAAMPHLPRVRRGSMARQWQSEWRSDWDSAWQAAWHSVASTGA